MGNTLIKDKTLAEYVPAKPGDPGHPGTPAVPERVTYENRMRRYEAPSSMMQRNQDGVTWTTPLDILRRMIGNSSLSAAAAHYSDSWGAVEVNGKTQRVPLEWTNAWIDRMESVRVVYPAQPAIPARPPVAGSPARTVYDMHFGWNASAQSLAVLPQGWGGTARFNITRPVGVVVGFTRVSDIPAGARHSFSAIRNGLVFGDGKIQVRENGQTRQTIASMTGTDSVEAAINGGTIEWHINGQMLYRGPFKMDGDFVLDAVLYAGDDAVDSPSLKAGAVEAQGAHLMLAPMVMGASGDGQGGHLNLPLFALLGGDAVAQAALKLRAIRASSAPLPRGGLRLRAMRLSASQAKNNAVAQMSLARLNAEGQLAGGDDAWVPKYSVGALGMLPLIVGGSSLTGGVLDGGMALQPLQVMSSQDAYGDGRLSMAAVQLSADLEAFTSVVRARELVGSVHSTTADCIFTIVFSEVIGASSSIQVAATVVQVQATERMQAQDESSMSSRIVAAMLEQLGLAEKHEVLSFRLVEGKPVLLDGGETWVVNTASQATTRYENYSFNSFMNCGCKHFGVRKDGVYLLEGRDDAGSPIEAGVALGKQDFGSIQKKGIQAVYAGVSASGQLFLKVKAQGGDEFVYKPRRIDRDLRQQRFDPGKGLMASYFEFDLVTDCGEFELDNITFNVVASKRRI